MSESSDFIVVTPEGTATDYSPRLSSDAVMKLAEKLLGLDTKTGEEDTETGEKSVWSAVGTSVVLGLTLNPLYPGGKQPSPYSEDQSVEFRKQKLHQQRSLVEPLLRSILEQDEYLDKVLAGVRLVEQHDDELDTLRFPAEQPTPWVTYKSHPFDSSFFVPLARFHHFMLHDKKAEFLRIASALGAKSVEMLEGESGSRSSNVKGGGQKMGVGGKVETGSSRTTSESFALDFKNETKPRNKPKLPEDTRWLVEEPLWQAMVETRLEQWATEFRIKFQYTSDFDVNAEMAAGFQALNLSIGGEYEAKQAVDQEYIVEFWPRGAYEDLSD